MTRFTLMMTVALLAGCQSLEGSNASSPIDRTMTVDGATLHYVEQGAGTPVIFLHGAFSDHRVWEPQRKAVAAKHRFIGLTMRYFRPFAMPPTPETTMKRRVGSSTSSTPRQVHSIN